MQNNFVQKIEKSKQQAIEHQAEQSIYVAPLPTDISKKDLRFLFSLCGRIKSIKISKKFQLRGFAIAFIHFFDFQAKEKAKKYYNGKMFGWKYLKVLDNKFREIEAKKQLDNTDKETVYEGEILNISSAPKKKVQKSPYYDDLNSQVQSKDHKYNQYKRNSRPEKSGYRSIQSSPGKQKSYRKKDKIKEKEWQRTAIKKEKISSHKVQRLNQSIDY